MIREDQDIISLQQQPSKEQAAAPQKIRFQYLQGFFKLLQNKWESYHQMFDSIIAMRQNTYPSVEKILTQVKDPLQKIQDISFKQPKERYLIYLNTQQNTSTALHPNRMNKKSLQQLGKRAEQLRLDSLNAQIIAFKRVLDNQTRNLTKIAEKTVQTAKSNTISQRILAQRAWYYQMQMDWRGL